MAPANPNTILSNTALFALLLIAVGLCFSRSAMTVGMFLLPVIGLSAIAEKVFWKRLLGQSALWLPMLWFAWHVASYAYSSNLEQWRYLLLIKLPFVFMPLGFAAIGGLAERQTRIVLWAYLLSVAITSLLTLIRYLLDAGAMHARLLGSKEVPIAFGILHVTYGLMQVLGAYVGYALWRQHQALKQSKWATLAFALGCFLVACTVLFASRTGWLALGAVGVLLFGRKLVADRTHRRRTLALGALGLCLLVSTLALPSVRLKVDNTVQDVQHFADGKRLDDWSIGKRVAALQTAWHLGLQHPVFGVGLADLWDEMQLQYAREPFRFDDPLQRAAPHNQIIEVFAGFGLTGLFLFMSMFLAPLVHASGRKRASTLVFYGVMLAGFCTDAVLEAQQGVNLFLLFYCVWFMGGEPATGQLPNLQA